VRFQVKKTRAGTVLLLVLISDPYPDASCFGLWHGDCFIEDWWSAWENGYLLDVP
jgi:hypothetical protein